MSLSGDQTGAGFVVALTSVRATMRRQRGYKKAGWMAGACWSCAPGSHQAQSGDQDALFELRTHPAATAAFPRRAAW